MVTVTSPLALIFTVKIPPSAATASGEQDSTINPLVASCTTLNVSVKPPPFTVIVAIRSTASGFSSTVTAYLSTVAEAEAAGVTVHQSSLLVTSSETFDLIESVFVPPVLEKLIPFVRMFSEITISGVAGASSLSEQAVTTGKRESTDSSRHIPSCFTVFFILFFFIIVLTLLRSIVID